MKRKEVTVPEPLWEQLLVAAAGPTVAALLGTLLVGLYLSRRAANDADRREQASRRAQFEFRQSLVERMVRAVVPLEMACRTHAGLVHRSSNDPNQLAEITHELDRLYLSMRTESAVLMRRLLAHYTEPELRQRWHAIVDLLTVRYFQVRGLDTPRLLETNAGPEHSGLTEDQLRAPRQIEDAIEADLERLSQLVVTGALTLPA
jgi:hypothetical protein